MSESAPSLSLTLADAPSLPDLRARTHTISDSEAVYAVCSEGLRPYVEATWGWDSADQRARHAAWWSNVSPILYDDEQGIVVVLDVTTTDERVYVGRLVIAERARGRGIGTLVLRELQRFAARTHRPVTLDVIDGNPSRRLYERLGFAQTGRSGPKIHMRWVPASPVPHVRLRPLDLESDINRAVEWYRDPDVLHYSEGDANPYDERQVRGMYAHLGDGGDVFVIEVDADGEWIAVGDAVLRRDTLPIVIGDPRFRGRGIGSMVLADLIRRARSRGWAELTVRKVFAYNERSLRLYRSAGFEEVGRSSDDDGRETVQLRLALSRQSGL